MRPLGRSEIKVSSLCLGTMMYGDQIGESEAHAHMDRAFAAGINFFDTAEMYTIPPKPETQGESERILGRWAASRGLRDKVVIATKIVGRSGFDWIRSGREARLTRGQLVEAVDRSLANLQTDYIDLYQTHWPDRRAQMFGSSLYGYVHYDEPGVPIGETLAGMDDLIKAGKIRIAGVSNETPYGVMQHVRASERAGLPRIASIQNAYNLLNRTFEAGLAEIALEEDVGLLAYSPLGQGVLTGKYLGGAKPAGSRGALFNRLNRYEKPGTDDAVRRYLKIAEAFGLHPVALAMQFVTTRPFVTSNIFGASSLEQLELMLSSLDVEWSEEMERAVNEAFAELQSPCP